MPNIKKEENGYDYPLLTNDPLIVQLSDKLKSLNLKMLDIKTRLDDRVSEYRKNCPHDHTTDNWEKDPNYCVRYESGSSPYGQKALVSKTCKDCGKVTKRPKGSNYEICYKCWGKMEHADTIQGQGSREQIYECKDCGSAVSHT